MFAGLQGLSARSRFERVFQVQREFAPCLKHRATGPHGAATPSGMEEDAVTTGGLVTAEGLVTVEGLVMVESAATAEVPVTAEQLVMPTGAEENIHATVIGDVVHQRALTAEMIEMVAAASAAEQKGMQ